MLEASGEVWIDYFRRYQSFLVSMGQARLLATIAANKLSGFPENMPDEWVNVLSKLGRMGDKTFNVEDIDKLEVSIEDEDILVTKDEKGVLKVHLDESDDISISMLMMFSGMTLVNKDIEDFPFENISYSQQLVMNFAYLDSFVGDSIRFVCKVRPEILKRNKKIEWKTIFDIGGWDGIVEHIVEEFVFEMGWESVDSLVNKMRSDLGLKMDISYDIVNEIVEAQQARNMVIHNGSRANKEYIKRTGRVDIGIGDEIVVDREFSHKTSNHVMRLASEIFDSISETHFGKTRSEVQGVWRW
jgi:hypothetical protein